MFHLSFQRKFRFYAVTMLAFCSLHRIQLYKGVKNVNVFFLLVGSDAPVAHVVMVEWP